MGVPKSTAEHISHTQLIRGCNSAYCAVVSGREREELGEEVADTEADQRDATVSGAEFIGPEE